MTKEEKKNYVVRDAYGPFDLDHEQEKIKYLLMQEFVTLRKQAGVPQEELSRRTGVGKASISQYVNGKNTPSNLTALQICTPFHINPAWLMGFDVPMKTFASSSSSERALTCNEEALIDKYRELNGEGQEKVLDYATDLIAGGRYIKSDPDKVVDAEA